MATRVNGSVGANSSHYQYYLTYNKVFNSTTMKWTVQVDTYLYVHNGSWQYNFKAGYNTAIGGATKVSKSGVSYSGAITASGTKTIHISTATQTYKASSSSRSVDISTTFKVSSGAKGPGTCKAAVKISLGAKISLKGDLKLTEAGEGVVNISIKNFEDVGYIRTVKIYKKTVSQRAWTLLATKYLKDVVLYSDRDVSIAENTQYKVEVYAPTDILTFTRLTVWEVIPSGLTINVSQRYLEEIDIKISNIIVDSTHARWVAIFYKKSSDPDKSEYWTKYQSQNISLDPNLGTWIFYLTELEPATSYDIVVRLLKANYNVDSNLIEEVMTECVTRSYDPNLIYSPHIMLYTDYDDNLYFGFSSINSGYDYEIQGYYRSSDLLYRPNDGSEYNHFKYGYKRLFDKKSFPYHGAIPIGNLSDFKGRYRFKFIIKVNNSYKIRTVGIDFNVYDMTPQNFTPKSGYEGVYDYGNEYGRSDGVESDYND